MTRDTRENDSDKLAFALVGLEHIVSITMIYVRINIFK